MNRNGNETESFAGNFVASDEQGLFFEVPIRVSHLRRHKMIAPSASPLRSVFMDAGHQVEALGGTVCEA
jgi:hypothetical protein